MSRNSTELSKERIQELQNRGNSGLPPCASTNTDSGKVGAESEERGDGASPTGAESLERDEVGAQIGERDGNNLPIVRSVRQRALTCTQVTRLGLAARNTDVTQGRKMTYEAPTYIQNVEKLCGSGDVVNARSCISDPNKNAEQGIGFNEAQVSRPLKADTPSGQSNQSPVQKEVQHGRKQSFSLSDIDSMVLRSSVARDSTNAEGSNGVRDRGDNGVERVSRSSCSSSSSSEEDTDPDFSIMRKRRYTYVNRCRKEPGEYDAMLKRRKLKLEGVSDNNLNTTKCCVRLRCFMAVDKPYLRAQSSRLLLMNQYERRKVLESMLDNQLQAFKFNGVRVCCAFLEKAFGFSRYLQAVVKGTPASRKSREQTVYDARRDDNSQRDSVICYLERLAESTADKMPDKDELHLPFFVKDDVYKDFTREFRLLHPPSGEGAGSKREVPSRSYFYSIWSKHCSKIKVRKAHRFTKCGDCERLRAALQEKRSDAKATQALREKKRVHNEMVARERREYAKKVQKATLYPNDYCSMIVDGADQSAFGLPHFTVSVKEARGHAIGVKLIGVLEHGSSCKLSLFLMTEQYETGANHVIEAVHRHLTQRKLSKPLPQTLYLQLDNCHRENKNQFLFGYLESLVAWGVFCEVFVSFLPIGHTHADVDQVFSRTSTRLRHHDAVSMDDLMHQLSKSYTPKPHVVHMKGIVNFSTLLKTSKCVSAPTGFTSYRYFHFTRSNIPNGSSERHYKTSCLVRTGCQDEWVPLQAGSDSGFLTSVPDLSCTPPTITTSPTNLEEINKRLASEESRIQNCKLRSLRQLRDEVYRSGKERFYWNLNDCIELNGEYRKSVENNDSSSGTDSVGVERVPEQDLYYDVNEFVATRVREEFESVPFWIGRIEDVEKNADGVIKNLVLRWHELMSGTSAYKGKYKPSDVGKGKNRRPFIRTVSVDTVLCRFQKLTRGRHISVNDQKAIWQSLH